MLTPKCGFTFKSKTVGNISTPKNGIFRDLQVNFYLNMKWLLKEQLHKLQRAFLQDPTALIFSQAELVGLFVIILSGNFHDKIPPKCLLCLNSLLKDGKSIFLVLP